MPKVSVIMNCYNGERFLREAIDSVRSQTFEDWEIIFWDNASTDGSAAIAQGYHDPRLRYFRGTTNVPLGEARKLALAEAQGEWIGFLDTDDLWYPQKLARQIAAVDATDHVLCYAGIAEITPEGELIREVIPKYETGWQLESQLYQFDINMVTPLIRHATLKQHGISFDPSVTASEEYNLFMRLAARGSFMTLPEVLGAWRISPGSLTDRQIGRLHVERCYTLDQLKASDGSIETRFPAALREAYARGDYYEARYAMSRGERGRAFKLLAANAMVDLRYAGLAAAALVPGLWKLLHGNLLKRRLLPMIFGAARYK